MKKGLQIYHNPRCRKSRETLNILEEQKQTPEIILYLENPPTAAKLKEILKKLNMEPMDLIRKSEAIYKEKFKGKELTATAWIKAMVKYPKLIERPIVILGNKAVLGRPPENVHQLL